MAKEKVVKKAKAAEKEIKEIKADKIPAGLRVDPPVVDVEIKEK